MDYREIPREVMETLIAVLDADEMACVDGWEFRAIIGAREIPLDEARLQELVRRGWLELADLPDGSGGENLHINVTPAGRYHGERWFRQHERKTRRRASR